MTDPEILERRYPIVLREFSIRKGSGGKGKHKGGDGVIREMEPLRPLTVSILSERRVLQVSIFVWSVCMFVFFILFYFYFLNIEPNLLNFFLFFHFISHTVWMAVDPGLVVEIFLFERTV